MEKEVNRKIARLTAMLRHGERIIRLTKSGLKVIRVTQAAKKAAKP